MGNEELRYPPVCLKHIHDADSLNMQQAGTAPRIPIQCECRRAVKFKLVMQLIELLILA